jgi:hypothetical protein
VTWEWIAFLSCWGFSFTGIFILAHNAKCHDRESRLRDNQVVMMLSHRQSETIQLAAELAALRGGDNATTESVSEGLSDGRSSGV